jgi:hypothetical protein
LRHPGPLAHFAGAAIEDLQLKISYGHDFVASIAIDVVDLEGRVIEERCTFRLALGSPVPFISRAM